MLRLVRMEDLANRATSQISGGQQQRVALARALAPHPEVLLLDEPLSALDLKLRKAMQIELKRLQRDTGITFVFVTHDQEEALTMSDRIAVMSQGKVRQVGSPREIYDHPAERFVAEFIGDANMLKGELTRVEGDRGLVRLADGIEVPARIPEGAPRSGEVTVVVRPEHASLDGGQGAQGLAAVVENAVFVGHGYPVSSAARGRRAVRRAPSEHQRRRRRPWDRRQAQPAARRACRSGAARLTAAAAVARPTRSSRWLLLAPALAGPGGRRGRPAGDRASSTRS